MIKKKISKLIYLNCIIRWRTDTLKIIQKIKKKGKLKEKITQKASQQVVLMR